MAQRYDALWKGVLDELFDDFLHFVLPNADEIFDMTRGFIPLDKELLAIYQNEVDGKESRRVDKLAGVYTKDGKENWLVCQGEVKGRRLVVLNLLSGTEFSYEKIASLTNETVEFVSE